MDATKDVLQGKWHELKGQVRQTFAKLTDDDIERMSGKSAISSNGDGCGQWLQPDQHPV